MYYNCITINLLKTCKNIINIKLFRYKHYIKNMNCVNLHPPNTIRGMINLDRNSIKKSIQVPKLKISEDCLNKILPFIKKILLKMEHLKPVRTITTTATTTIETETKPLSNSCNGGFIQSSSDNNFTTTTMTNIENNHNDHHKNSNQTFKEILLHPLVIKNWNDLPKDDLEKFDVTEKNFFIESIELTYDNWKADELLKFILPEDKENLSSYSRIGHIVHVNLKDHLLPYKQIIGEILKDKVVGCRTVVNKIQTITNTYRNFNLELICGDDDYHVQTKENGCMFEFDFSKVYWNPRLSTEHERIVNLLNEGDVLYDVFAGVGPFCIPAAKKKKCHILANDLNPESYKWLNVNIKNNKCSNLIETFNKDGKDFIVQNIHEDLLKRWKSNKRINYSIHVTMNLPAMAIEFLSAFNDLFTEDDKNEIIKECNDLNALPMPIIHVYTFTKDENGKDSVKMAVEKHLKYPLNDNLIGIYFVRNVAPNKDMYRVSFRLTREILFRIPSSKKRSLSPTSSSEICVDEKKKSQ